MKLKKPKFWDSSRFSFWAILFFPISILFLLFAFINKYKISKKFSIPVICVGNIYVGGTGKTPLASEIFKITKSLGKNPAFVKKYYDYLKDEIAMLKKVGTTFVSKSRKEAIESLIKNKNDIAILDDGFQDYTIKKNFSVVCFNQKQWIGNGLVIPSGPLRERITAVNRSDCIVINGERNVKIEDQIYKKNKNAKIFYSKYKPVDINRFKDKQIYAFSGIGNPSNFFDLLRENNLNLIGTNSFPDHYYFTKSDLEILIKKINSEKNQILLTTEKDYFRIHDNFKTHFQYLKIELEIENKDNFIELIKKNI
jgi:tetraacyldisaccharide 4'-kinase